MRLEPAACFAFAEAGADGESGVYGAPSGDLLDEATEELRVLGVLEDMAAGGSEKVESMPRAKATGFAGISEDGAGVGRPVGDMA